MPKIHHLQHSWNRHLSLEDYLSLCEALESALPDESPGLIEAKLRDGSTVSASSVPELRSDLTEEADDDVEEVSVMVGDENSAHLWLERDKSALAQLRGGSECAVLLRAKGMDEAKVHGAFGPIKRRIDNRFEAIARAEAEPTSPSFANSGGVMIGSMSGGNVAVSGSGPASSSSGPSGDLPPGRWWQQAWITIGAPIVVLVIAGIILALVLGH
jgi:hypothetical protein